MWYVCACVCARVLVSGEISPHTMVCCLRVADHSREYIPRSCTVRRVTQRTVSAVNMHILDNHLPYDYRSNPI